MPAQTPATIPPGHRFLLTGAAALSAALFALAALGVVAVALGALVMFEDARVTGEVWDGLGLLIGGLVVVGGGIWAMPHLGLALATVHARRRCRDHGETEALRGCGSATALLGFVVLMLVWVVQPLGPIDIDAGLLLVATLLLAASTASGVLVTAAAVVARPAPPSGRRERGRTP